MSDSAPVLRGEQSALAESDYDSILRAVMETARGRWFLHEYVCRNRNADTGALLAAIDRIESLLKTREVAPEPVVPPVDATSSAPAALAQLRTIAENLIECGAPTYLCNELLRRIEELAMAYATPAEARAPAGLPMTTSLPQTDAAATRDPFADILALSPEERIALFT